MADIAGLAAADLRSGVKVGSIVGTLPAYTVCANDGDVGCIVIGPSFATAAVSGAAAKILTGQTLGGISGSATASPANCTTDGGTACVATSAYPSALATGAASKIAAGSTLAGISGTAGVRPPDCSTDGGTACVVVGPTYAAVITTGAAAKIITGQTLAGVSGTATPAPANCAADGATSCVAVTNFPAVDKITKLSTANLSKIHSTLTVAGLTGTLADCSSDGGMSCFSTAAFPAANAAGGAAKILAGQSLAGITGTAAIRPADCASDNQLNCVTKTGFPAVNLSVLTTGVLKSGMTVAGVTGSYPNAAYPLTAADGYIDLDAPTFNAKIKSSTPFGWFDRNGTRFTGAGDVDIAGAAIKNGVDIFGTTGSFGPDCSSDGQTGCIATTQFKAANTANFNSWDIRAGKSIAGIPGNIGFNKNTANFSVFSRQTGTAANPSTTVADFYDTIDDFNNALAGLPPLAPSTPSIASIFRDTASDLGTGGGIAGNGICDGTEDCVYLDKMTGLYWIKDDATVRNWEIAITFCEGLTLGGNTNWRVPTQKELLMASINRIFEFKTALNITNVAYWTATTVSTSSGGSAHVVSPSNATTGSVLKTNTANVLCVSP